VSVVPSVINSAAPPAGSSAGSAPSVINSVVPASPVSDTPLGSAPTSSVAVLITVATASPNAAAPTSNSQINGGVQSNSVPTSVAVVTSAAGDTPAVVSTMTAVVLSVITSPVIVGSGQPAAQAPAVETTTVIVNATPTANAPAIANSAPAQQPASVKPASPSPSSQGSGKNGNNGNGKSGSKGNGNNGGNSGSSGGNNGGNKKPGPPASPPASSPAPFSGSPFGSWPFGGWGYNWGPGGAKPTSGGGHKKREVRRLRFMRRQGSAPSTPAAQPAPTDASVPSVIASVAATDGASTPSAPSSAPTGGAAAPSILVSAAPASASPAGSAPSVAAPVPAPPVGGPNSGLNATNIPAGAPAPAPAPAPAVPPTNSTAPPSPIQVLQLAIPINTAILRALTGIDATAQPANSNAQLTLGTAGTTDEMLSTVKFQIARRDVGAGGAFVPLTGTGPQGQGVQMSIDNGKLMVTGFDQLDGEYVVLVPYNGPVATPAAVTKSQSSSTINRVPKGISLAVAIGFATWAFFL
jgi:hypothetical protein